MAGGAEGGVGLGPGLGVLRQRGQRGGDQAETQGDDAAHGNVSCPVRRPSQRAALPASLTRIKPHGFWIVAR